MAVNSVTAKVNGTSYNLTYNSSSGAYEATITAPNKSSYTQTNKYYDVSVTARDDYGNSTTVNSANATFGSKLKLYVKEKVAPVINSISPATGAYITNNKPTISWKVSDADSGVNKSTIKLYIDNTEVDGTINASVSGGVYTCSYVPSTALSEGSHTLKFTASDNDGNSVTSTVTIKVDTVPPVLNVTSPTNNLKTNVSTVNVVGTTNDATSSPVTLTINGESVEVSANGSFSKTLTLSQGTNTITIVSKDGAGKTTTVTRTVYFDNTAPVISTISITPNPVDAGKTFVISVKVSD